MPSVDLGEVKGRQGLPGTPGSPGNPGDNGKGFNPRGEWQSGVMYNSTSDTVDVVYYQGSSFYCKATETGTVPPPDDSAMWGLIVAGINRLVFQCTIDPLDWTATNNTPFTYLARKSFPHGFLSANGFYNLSANNVVVAEYEIVIGAIEIGETNDNIVFYATDHYQSYLPVKVYTDIVEEVAINGN